MKDHVLLNKPNGAIPSLGPSEAACVHLLEEALIAAKSGQITSVALVCCMSGGFGASFAGMQGAELNLGLDSLKSSILAAIKEPPSRRPSILRAR